MADTQGLDSLFQNSKQNCKLATLENIGSPLDRVGTMSTNTNAWLSPQADFSLVKLKSLALAPVTHF